ncbi:MAG: putative sugar O-methyltransferase [Hyphomicrobiales bacterium]
MAHDLLQRYILGSGNPVFRSPSYKRGRQIARLQGRAFDMDMLRHACTLELLTDHWPAINEVCVIGDGQTNFLSAALASGHFSRVISVNLVDVLLSDLQLIDALKSVSDADVKVARTQAELDAARFDGTQIILVPANRASILHDQEIDAFVNIASFQEMTPEIVHEYFEIIASNKAFLYCCNRELKILPGGERLEFASWPWGSADIQLDDLCPWQHSYYVPRPPFRQRYDGSTRHRIACFQAN